MTFSYLIKRKKIILTFLFTFLSSGDFDVLYKKASIENSYRNTVEYAIARTLDRSLFEVNVSVSLIKNPKFLNYQEIATVKAEETLAEQKAREKKKKEEAIKPGLLPGLPAIPTPSVDEKGLAVDTRVAAFGKEEKENVIPDEYIIDRVEVSVRLEETIADFTLEQELTTVIRSVIPDIDTCPECIDFESKSFLLQAIKKEMTSLQSQQTALEGNLDKRLNNSDKSIENLVENVVQRIDDMESNNDNAKFDLLEKLDDLDNSRLRGNQDLELTLYDKLNELTDKVKLRLEDEVKNRDREGYKTDSIMWSNFINRENSFQKQQDSLMKDLIENHRNDAKAYATNVLKFAEEQLERVLTKEDIDDMPTSYDKADLGMQYLGSKDIMDYLPWAVSLMSIFIVLFVLMRKQKPIYLKPKAVPAPPKPEPSFLEKQIFEEDNDVIRGEVKNLRQAAVAESIREKQGATEILSNWLDDESEVESENDKKDDDQNETKDDSDKKGKKNKK